ncbi:MAG: YfhO family protein [Bacteroidales bacterium]|nr:YfhO family protein [Bacteroidales bacterium]
MQNYFKQQVLPHLLAVVIFFLISALYFSPVLSGKKLDMHDWKVWQAAAHEKNTYEDETGEITLWTNSMFSGMPTYLISTPKEKNVFDKVQKIITFGVGGPLFYLFYYLLGFYILLIVFKLKPWLAVPGAIGFGFSSYFFIIIAAGHVTKALAIGYMAPVIAGFYLAYDRKALPGMLLMSFFLALQILTNHLQIVYYTFLILLVLGIILLIEAIREKKIFQFAKTTGILVIGAVLAIGINASNIITTQEYAPYSMRGKDGLTKKYATDWSYGLDETLTLLIPNVKGGASGAPLSKDSESYNVIEKYYGKQNANDFIESMPVYFGAQPFTSGPVYIGAIIFFLFVLSTLIVKGKLKWWLVIVTILSIMLAWGRNFMWFTDLFFDYFPGYNKFRTVSMTLVIAEFAMPLLAFLGLREIFLNKVEPLKLKNSFYISIGIVGVVLLAFIAKPDLLGVEGEGEYSLAKQMAEGYRNHPQYNQLAPRIKADTVSAMHADRKDVVRADAFRSLMFVVLAAALIFLIMKKKIKHQYAFLILAVLILTDMWVVNRRYLNNDNFVLAKKFEVPYLPTRANNIILQDKDPHYRVCNLAVSVFNDASTSYFHKSIGGYHGAKMQRYQTLMDSVMASEMQMAMYLANVAVSNQIGEDTVSDIFNNNSNTPVLNMLNTRYVIYNGGAKPIRNNSALGNAWFVKDYEIVPGSNEELITLRNLDTKNKAVIDEKFEAKLADFKLNYDPNAGIYLTDYAPNYLRYESETKNPQLALFSEIYYPKGWQAYIDGKETEHFSANYVLRSMIVPEGKHVIEFKFEPKSYKIGNIISYISSLIILLLIAYFGFRFLKSVKQKG